MKVAVLWDERAGELSVTALEGSRSRQVVAFAERVQMKNVEIYQDGAYLRVEGELTAVHGVRLQPDIENSVIKGLSVAKPFIDLGETYEVLEIASVEGSPLCAESAELRGSEVHVPAN